ncbi:MAG: MmoB/DmpM family protein [Bradyrhizobium sp.]
MPAPKSAEKSRTRRRLAGPVLRSSELALAAADAIREDNPNKDVIVDDHGGYIRIEAEEGLVLRKATMEEYLGRSFSVKEIEHDLISFSGQIELTDECVRWYFNSPAGS